MSNEISLKKRVAWAIRSLQSEGYIVISNSTIWCMWVRLKHRSNGNEIRIVDNRMYKNGKFLKCI